jgi:hypothetical protein
MAWLYVPDMEGLNSELNPSLMDTEPFVMWRGDFIPPEKLSRKWKRDGWMKRLSGLTLEPSTAQDGVERWILSLEAFHANPIQRLESNWEPHPRDLWPDVARIVGEVLPEYIFFENVPNIVKWRLDSIIVDLHQVGYDCSWCVLGAVDAGAPHRRNRWFLFGVRNAANTSGFGRTKNEPHPSWQKPNVVGCGNQTKWGGRFETWWEVEPSMGRLADGCSHWVDKLRLLGNGVVPQQAHLALKILTENLGLRRIENESK